jgi:hypothetical protein
MGNVWTGMASSQSQVVPYSCQMNKSQVASDCIGNLLTNMP